MNSLHAHFGDRLAFMRLLAPSPAEWAVRRQDDPAVDHAPEDRRSKGSDHSGGSTGLADGRNVLPSSA
jgi:hypothetical protein